MDTLKTKRAFLESYGFIVGARDTRLNTDFPGAFMCCEPFDGGEIPWCIVGDDLWELINEAHDHLLDLIG